MPWWERARAARACRAMRFLHGAFLLLVGDLPAARVQGGGRTTELGLCCSAAFGSTVPALYPETTYLFRSCLTTRYIHFWLTRSSLLEWGPRFISFPTRPVFGG